MRRRWEFARGCAFIASLSLYAGAACAQANDNWANRTPILALPFTVSEAQVGAATVEPTDPDPPCRPFGANPLGNSLWYAYTTGASVEYLTLTLTNTAVRGAIGVYSGTPGAFVLESGGCGAFASSIGNANARIAGLRLRPNTAYSIVVGSVFNVGATPVLDFDVRPALQYVVTRTSDSQDGTCDADCSLREAIGASSLAPGAVLVPAGTYPLALAGALENGNATGDLDLLVGMGLYGAGMEATIIDGQGADRVLDLCPGPPPNRCTVILRDLTLANGVATAGSMGEPRGGALRTFGSAQFVALERVRMRDGFAGELGGAAFLAVPATLRECRVDGNGTGFFGGGLALIVSPSRPVEVLACTVDDNESGQDGGGIQAQGDIRIANSTISGNRAQASGGGIYATNGTLSLASTTITGNRASLNNLFATNRGGGVRMDAQFGGNHRIVNSVIAANTVLNPNDPAPDCVLFNQGLDSRYNLVQRPGSCGFGGVGDVTGFDAQLAPTLADNGGSTPTHFPLPGSPVVDGGDPAGCADPAGLPLPNDQRGAGFPRVAGKACDQGAIETPGDLVFRNGFE